VLRLSVVLLALVLGGCFTLTNDRPDFNELDSAEQQAVDTVLGELRSLEAELKASRGCSIAEVVDRQKVDVSFQELILAENLGDGTIHLSIWENLSEHQKQLVQTWFATGSEAAAETLYKKLFYEFLAVTQGTKEFIYDALEVSWLMQNRSWFNIEKDAVRIAVAHFDGVGRGAEMRGFLTQSCAPLVKAYASEWDARYQNGRDYLKNPFNLSELYNPAAPIGYLYFVCRWADRAMNGPEEPADSLGGEVDWILSLRARRCQSGTVIPISPNS
jgi:hypothetical protein